VTFPIAAKVGTVLVSEGQTVKQGDQLLSFDETYFQTQLKSIAGCTATSAEKLHPSSDKCHHGSNKRYKHTKPILQHRYSQCLERRPDRCGTMGSDQVSLSKATTSSDIAKWTAQLEKGPAGLI